MTDDLAPQPRHPLPASLARALAWLNERLDEPIQLDALAEVAGVRPRTLEEHFHRYLGATPLGWVRRTRLARVRQQLRDARSDATVTEIATGNGFSQLGRFAVEYRKQFGESPSQTMKAARSTAPDDANDSDEAMRLSWRALTAAFMVGPASCSAALEDVERARELAPQLALPVAIAAWCHAQRAAHNFGDSPQLDRTMALQLANEAERLAPHSSLTLCLCGGALTLLRRLEAADRLIEHSLAMEPWSPWAWLRRGWHSAYTGDAKGAVHELQMTLHLMPFEPVRHLAFIGIGCAHFNAGRYEQSARWIQDAMSSGPESYWAERVLVAAMAHSGAVAEARRRAHDLLRKDANLTVTVAREAWPFRPAFVACLGDGLTMAGVPRA